MNPHYTEMSSAEHEAAELAFYEKLEEIIDRMCNDYTTEIEFLNNSEYTRHYLLERNLGEFSVYITEYPEDISPQLIDNYFKTYGCKLKSEFDYYYTLRFLNLLLKDHTNFTLFDKEYRDPQFIQAAYKVNPEIVQYLTKTEQHFIKQNFFSKCVTDGFKCIKTVQAFVKYS